jgi:hypothetical protein
MRRLVLIAAACVVGSAGCGNPKPTGPTQNAAALQKEADQLRHANERERKNR